MINEAVFALGEGLATAAEIDEAMKLGANHPIGPLALCDLIGLDVQLAVMQVLFESFKDPKYRAAPLLIEMVEAGYLGRKTGRGFLCVLSFLRCAPQCVRHGPGKARVLLLIPFCGDAILRSSLGTPEHRACNG